MGDILSILSKNNFYIFEQIISRYENIRNEHFTTKELFDNLNNIYKLYTKKRLSDFELENIEDTLVDGVIQTNKYILVGWNNDSEEIDLQLINDIISNIENREQV